MQTLSERCNPRHRDSVAFIIERQIARAPERLWRHEDFTPLPADAVSQALSRLTRRGFIQRVAKGVYYKPRLTPFGDSRPSPSALARLPLHRKSAFPSGISAANLLGFTTQNPARQEIATSAGSLPRIIIGKDTRLHTRRPEAWNALPALDAALLDFLRSGGRHSELSPEETVEKLLAYLKDEERFVRLVNVADSEPPRVRAILGAAGQQLRKKASMLKPLRESLNPLSRFDFGLFAGLKYAREWQAKGGIGQ